MSMRAWLFLVAAIVALAGSRAVARQVKDSPVRTSQVSSELKNPGFETGEAGNAPPGWVTPTPNATAVLVPEGAVEGKFCVLLSRLVEGDTAFSNIMQAIEAGAYRGKRVELSASVRFEGGAGGKAQMWMRVDRPGGLAGFFDNMQDRPITGGGWAGYTIRGDVEDDAEILNVGFFLLGPGRAWIDGVSLRVLGDAGAGLIGPRALEARGVENISAFARLAGVLRYFHPTNETLKFDWDDYAIRAVQGVEGAASEEELAKVLTAWVSPIAPTVRVWAGTREQAPAVPLMPEGSTHIVGMRHMGYAPPGQPEGANVYSTKRVKEPLGRDDAKRDIPGPGTAVTMELCPGVCALVPISLYSDGKHTLPHATAKLPEIPERPEGWTPSAKDRATRLAAVCLGWGTLKQFYPYFDVVPKEWDGALAPALVKAAEDTGPEQFWRTLAVMHAHLHDGHGYTAGPGSPTISPRNFSWVWVGEELVVSAVDAGQTMLKPGDVVLEIEGKTVAERYAELAPTICSATEQWRRERALRDIGWGPSAQPVKLKIGRGGGTIDIDLPRGPIERPFVETHPADGTEGGPGIVYFNLNGAETGALMAAMPKLVGAKGVIFDLRGYPGSAGYALFSHLSDKTVTSARWNVPVLTMPDFERVMYEKSNWTLLPEQPRITAPVAFLTGGGAISYAESCMGIVEGFRLGEIVGGTTAGTNGNITTVRLPAGYGLTFTGMRVVKHNGVVHQGVGIAPTLPVSPTIAGLAAGRDEVMEKAVEVLAAKIAGEGK